MFKGNHDCGSVLLLSQKETRRSGFLLFWVTRYNYLGDHAARAKISSLDAFAFKGFASTAESPQPYGFCFAELSTPLLVALSKLVSPIKSILMDIGMCAQPRIL